MAELQIPNGDRTGPRPSITSTKHASSPSVVMNGHFASVGDAPSREQYEHGIQVVNENKEFNHDLSTYLALEKIIPAGFNYHLISVFGSQSTGKSTLLNHLFGTEFGVMDEADRRQTTRGIWMSINKRGARSDATNGDGAEGEDQDFERKSALFALATSEVLIVNMWETQVGLYQGANMGLLKTVFEVNLQLFVKGNKNIPRSLLFFVLRDSIGTTPLSNLRETILKDLSNIWTSISKPEGLEQSRIEDYFDFAFVALPHKILQAEKFVSDIEKLSTRFREGYKDPKISGLLNEEDQPVFLPEYHRRIPADGFPVYAEGIWDQILNNKDLDLPTQQELLAQFRCDEIAREALIGFDEAITPLEEKQAADATAGTPKIIPDLGKTMNEARTSVLKNFETEASRYHKGVYTRKRAELESKVDARLKALFKGQLSAAHKSGVATFSDAVSAAVKAGQKKGASYDFASIVESEKQKAITRFEEELNLFRKELDEVASRLRKEEMRRLATRVERWVRSRLGESVGLEFNKLGSGRGGSGAPEHGEKPSSEKDLWDRIWAVFTETVEHAEARFTERARSFDASPEEVEVGIWRLRRKSWGALRSKIEEELMEGNLLLNLRENFEDKFRYDADGVPRIWRPTDDIEGVYTRARESTLQLIPLLARFRLARTNAPPPLDAWIGTPPASVQPADEEDMAPIGGVDEDEGKSLEEEMTVLGDAKQADLSTRFKKMADGVYVEAKRGAIGGVTQVPLYFYALLLALGWNEIVAVLRNPVYFIFLILAGIGAYVTYSLNLWGPMFHMANAASQQGLEIGKQRLREFLESSDTGRQAVAMSGSSYGREDGGIRMDKLNGHGKKAPVDEDEVDEI
ncbi:Dynamin-like GTPase that mediates homotypic ER fusion [Coniosporium tulheliwenetii]|uniref:Dynamin-like GTPase that mediates homotypic ER fusion n=1 Tax=Coniosporium tulheliwenetii TaxID=3383036 RepID=A0ACC2Z2D0_9PEZI|nr:Dynamin-like GTPase that mediates homotypic ER fusion [Cladosporium sp. JES 115]